MDETLNSASDEEQPGREEQPGGVGAPDYSVESRLIHGEMRSRHWCFDDHIVPPISASVSYRLHSADHGAERFSGFANPDLKRHGLPAGAIYDRLHEPTRAMLEDHLAIAEGGEACVAFATGMAAISGALGVLLRAGDRVIVHRTIYGCTYSLFKNWFPRLGIEVTFADLTQPGALPSLLERYPDTMVVYGETPANPTLELLDLSAMHECLQEENKQRGEGKRVMSVIDNTFATPFCQRPLEFGVDVVVQSLTKSIGGFGTDMGGAVICPELLEPDLLLYRKDFGAALSPKAAWPSLVQGLPTLALRMRHQQTAALAVAKFLEEHEAVASVAYPGLQSFPWRDLAERQLRDYDGEFAPGAMIYFRLEGDPETAKRRGAEVIDALAGNALTVTLAVSLGQIRTLIEHPASMTHSTVPAEDQLEYGIDPAGIRISIGLESVADIIRDLERALGTLSLGAL